MTTFKLEPADVEQPPSVAGDMRVSLSAYDVPLAITTDEREPGVLRIGLQYIDKETGHKEKVDEGLYVLIGNHSGKMLGVIVKGAGRPQEIANRAVDGIQRRLEHARRDNERLNYQLVSNLFRRRLGDLLTMRR